MMILEIIKSIFFFLSIGILGIVILCPIPIIIVEVLNKFVKSSKELDNDETYRITILLFLTLFLVWLGYLYFNLTNHEYEFFIEVQSITNILLVIIIGFVYNYIRNGRNKIIRYLLIIFTLISTIFYSFYWFVFASFGHPMKYFG